MDKKISYRRGTVQCVVSVEILPIATQQCRNYLQTKSCCRQSLTICAINYTGRALELGGIINLERETCLTALCPGLPG